MTEALERPGAEILASEYHQKMDAFEQAITKSFPPLQCEVRHIFTPGLYLREIYMPAGALITSKIHVTQHPYIVSQGRLKVLTEQGGVVEIVAPHTGITEPNTRRALLIEEDTIWTTCHANPKGYTTPEEVEADIILPHNSLKEAEELPCLGSQLP